MFRLLGLHLGSEVSAEAAVSLAGVPRDEAALPLGVAPGKGRAEK
jgi:hypothetical protein